MKLREITQNTLMFLAVADPALGRAMMQSTNHRVFTGHGLTMHVSSDNGRHHLSISHPRRYPTWNEIRDARYELLPDVPCMAMILPPKCDYVNIHPNCFHLWEIDQPDETRDGLAMSPSPSGEVK